MRDRLLAFIYREENHHLKLFLVVFVMLFLSVFSSALIRGVHASGSTFYIATVANGGSDSNNCSQSTPCLSFNRAYQVASPGDTVLIGAGTYGDQNLVDDAGKDSASAQVTFQPAPGASVEVGQLEFGASYDEVGASHVVINDIISNSGADFRQTNDVTLNRVIFSRAVNAIGAHQLTINGGSWSGGTNGNHSQFTAYCGSPRIGPSCGSVRANQDIQISGVWIHNFTRNSGDTTTPSSCLEIDDGDNVNLTGNHFGPACDAHDVKIVATSPSSGVTNSTLENNIFEPATNNGGTGSGNDSLLVDPMDNPVSSLALQNNSFAQAWTVNTTRSNNVTGAAVNNLGYFTCASNGFTFSHNAWIGNTCDASDVASITLSNIHWTSDYHIQTGSSAIDVADTASCPANDIDGDARPQGSACDAGADEYMASSLPAAPANSAAPTLSGTTAESFALTTSLGTWTNNPASYTFQWQRCDADGLNCTVIPGAKDNSYDLSASDIGYTIRSVVTAANTVGSTSASSLASATVSATVAAPSNTSLPSISGYPAVGSTLNATNGSWTGSPSYGYEWQRCDSSGANCADISGATANTYTLLQADSGKTLRITVTATNGSGSSSAHSGVSNQVLPVYGDFNNDNQANGFDLAIMLGQWNSGSSQLEDLNTDGTVNGFDLAILLNIISSNQ